MFKKFNSYFLNPPRNCSGGAEQTSSGIIAAALEGLIASQNHVGFIHEDRYVSIGRAA
jgi:hypothetical protein